MRQLLVEKAELSKMAQHARREYPRECLGILVGRCQPSGGRVVLEAVPVPNIHRTPLTRVSCHPRDYQRAERRALELGAEVCGFYHSHPDHPAVPSPTDLEAAAFTDWSYLILSVSGGEPRLRSWTLRPDRQAFEEETIISD